MDYTKELDRIERTIGDLDDGSAISDDDLTEDQQEALEKYQGRYEELLNDYQDLMEAFGRGVVWGAPTRYRVSVVIMVEADSPDDATGCVSDYLAYDGDTGGGFEEYFIQGVEKG